MSPYLGQSFREKRRALKAQFIDSNQGLEHSNMRLKNKLSRNKDRFNSKDSKHGMKTLLHLCSQTW